MCAENRRMTELATHPVAVRVSVPSAQRTKLLAAAHDTKHDVVLRIEGIEVTGSPGVVYDVRLDGRSVGTLATYGTDLVELTVDDAVAHALRSAKTKAVDVTFVPQPLLDPQGKPLPVELHGRIRIAAVRLVAR